MSPKGASPTVAAWEPWRPEVGQQVRIRLSAECPLAGHDTNDGRIGRVVRVRSSAAHRHNYGVELDESDGWSVAYYAATELVPLE